MCSRNKNGHTARGIILFSLWRAVSKTSKRSPYSASKLEYRATGESSSSSSSISGDGADPFQMQEKLPSYHDGEYDYSMRNEKLVKESNWVWWSLSVCFFFGFETWLWDRLIVWRFSMFPKEISVSSRRMDHQLLSFMYWPNIHTADH